MKPIQSLLAFFIILLLAGCREEYQPPVVTSGKPSLVVEGFLNSGAGPTSIRLSLTTPLSDALQVRPVDGAVVRVEGKDNRQYPLVNQPGGTYFSPSLGIAAGSEYRLLIDLQDGRKYRSEFVMAKTTPPIDSLTWERNERGVEVAVSTHDPANNTKFYRWEYEETWEIHARFFSSYKYINGEVKERDLVNDNVYYCWRNQNSTSILLGSSTRLDADVVSKKNLLLIPNGSDKLSVRYSVLVKQYAMDQPGYEFLQLMKKNTESLGSLFDTQPSEVRGNIHSLSDPEELVIGYIMASSVTEKRIFIDTREVPDWGYSYACYFTLVSNHPDSFKKYYPVLMPYGAHYEGIFLVGYYSADPSCVDCTLRGINKKPLFW